MFYDYSPGFSVPGLPGGFRFFLGGGGGSGTFLLKSLCA